jgi:predicted methyltransferase
MDIQAEKIELIKALIDTQDINVINTIKSILKISNQGADDWADLHDVVITDIKEALKEIENGQGISHLEARETYKKWL